MSNYEDFVEAQYDEYYETCQEYKKDLNTLVKMEQDTVEILVNLHESIHILKDKVEILEKFLKELDVVHSSKSPFTDCDHCKKGR